VNNDLIEQVEKHNTLINESLHSEYLEAYVEIISDAISIIDNYEEFIEAETKEELEQIVKDLDDEVAELEENGYDPDDWEKVLDLVADLHSIFSEISSLESN
jgi:hypothetical protein